MKIQDCLSDVGADRSWTYVEQNVGRVSAFKAGYTLAFNSVDEDSLLRAFQIPNDKILHPNIDRLFNGFYHKQFVMNLHFIELIRWPYTDANKAVSIFIDLRYLAEVIDTFKDSEAVSFIMFNMDKLNG